MTWRGLSTPHALSAACAQVRACRRRHMAPTAQSENAPISAPMRADRPKEQGTDPTQKAGQDWDSRDARCRVRTSDILLVRQALYR
jgi:hypothetical protein